MLAPPVPTNRRRRRSTVLAAALCVASALVGVASVGPGAHADEVTVSQDTLRTGWDANEPRLTPATVSASSYGQLFDTPLDGQVYAQPLVAAGTLLAVTEADQAYGLDPVTGAVRWHDDVGPYWPAATTGCGDLTPDIGITSTPVYDPSTGTAYFTAKRNNGPDALHPHWYLYAVDIRTGDERAGFPAVISGSPSNDPTDTFDAASAMQRPGLLLLGGVVYAGFASHCDYSPYVGYVAGIDASTGHQTALWATEDDSSDGEAGIWQSGGGLISDGPGRILFATGNGVSPAPGPGDQPPGHLAESVVQLQVQSDGSLRAADFFSPVDNTQLDREDADLGSGGPLAIPDGYGTRAHPHLLVQVGKNGTVYLLDRDALGGDAQGTGGTDDVVATAGPEAGVWGHPAFFGGDGGYVYLIENGGYLRAYKLGVDTTGAPSLTSEGTTPDLWGFGSGSPVVTSDGTTSGSGLVWAVHTDGGTGVGAQLRAYAAVPEQGVLSLVRSFPIGTASKFVTAATDAGRVYVGTRDGRIFGFGSPVSAALTGPSTHLGDVHVGRHAARTVTLTATTTLTVHAVRTSAPFAVGHLALPTVLAAGATLRVPVTFDPHRPGAVSGTLSVATSAGGFGFSLNGTGSRPGLYASSPTVAFGKVPTRGRVTLSVSITNASTRTETITGASGPTAPFAVAHLPRRGLRLAPGASVTVAVTLAPRHAGHYRSKLTVRSGAGGVTVVLTATGVTGAGHLALSPAHVDFGPVSVGRARTMSFTISDTGNLTVTITKAAPPAGEISTSTPVSEGQQLSPGDVIHQQVTFRPTRTGTVTAYYLITGNDGRGHQRVVLTGTGVAG